MSRWDMRPSETYVHRDITRGPVSVGRCKVTSRCKVIDVD
ncbi:hypothetical protein SAMN02787118_107395 [Streptomyces mirabilis]|jgi:hypothetical protein|uniref:Uncharacterized protein n=1 Tax=Streptomyces mirabilis TaxID=68239 RepID=A0A1I2JC97_9ACTN|nr:hypothetical protein SAMN02787118_107395 [Streptomyces mirabilis]